MDSALEPEPVRVFLIGMGQKVAGALARYLSGDPRMALVGVARNPVAAQNQLSLTPTDLVLLEWSVLNGSPEDTVRSLRSARPGLVIIGVAADSEAYRSAAPRWGVDGVISSSRIAEELESMHRSFHTERIQ